MPLILGFLLFALPFLAYALLWQLGGRKGGKARPLAALGVGAAGIVLALAFTIHWGLSRGMERGETYVPARIEGGTIRR
jgi:hypothetical protein